MVASSVKRGRRFTVHSSDEEDAKAKRSRRGHGPDGQKPEKSDRATKIAVKESRPKPIYSFFNSIIEQEPGQIGGPEDHIDDSLDEDLLQIDLPVPRSDRLSSASQKFVKSANNVKSEASRSGKATPTIERADTRPWVERFAPVSIEELAVHKKKIVDVGEWLENALAGIGREKLLVLRGPSGAGKTATVTLLSQALNLDILEWRNPVGSKFASERPLSLSSQFEDFIARSGSFGKLDMLETTNEAIQNRQDSSSSIAEHGRRKIILIEDFPNTFTRSSDVIQSFRNTIIQYLASNTPISASRPSSFTPLIMIISETLLTTTTAAADSFTAHRVLGPQILNHNKASVIDFNPIAVTILTKALELVIRKEARASGRKTRPGEAIIKKLGEFGDIRSAVSSLEFLCLRGDQDGDWSGKISNQKPKRAKILAKLSAMERESLELITQREASLGIFHAVGKVVYNKRDEALAQMPGVISSIQPPEHLSQHRRSKLPQVSIESLFDETGTDTATFIAALHENYLLSCDSIESVDSCLDALGESDLLGLSADDRGYSQGTGNDSLRQAEVCFQIAVRGILFSLPSPVSRRGSTYTTHNAKLGRGNGSKGDAFKMLYPRSARIWRQAQEIESIVEQVISRLAQVNIVSEAWGYSAHDSGHAGVEKWKSHGQGKFGASADRERPGGDSGYLAMISGSSARREMILERLPYMAKIESEQTKPTLSLPDIEKVVSFRGTSSRPENDASEDDEVITALAQGAPDREESHAKHITPHYFTPKPEAQAGVYLRLPVDTAVQKLVLSDDDIEDD